MLPTTTEEMEILMNNLKVCFEELTNKDIKSLMDSDSLYIFDFRSISEDMSYDIPAMFKYENLLPWVLSDMNVCVNEEYDKIKYPNSNNLIVIPKDIDSRVSMFERLNKVIIPKNINKIYSGIPHPDSDNYVLQKGMETNFSYTSFINKNDKTAQKLAFSQYTPKWEIINEGLKSSIQEGCSGRYIKRQFSSGGYSVLSPEDIQTKKFFLEDGHTWYVEDCCYGKSCSIQIYKESDEKMTVFGFANQIIEDGKHFMGAELLRLKQISVEHKKNIERILQNCSGLLEGYNGFFGMDFIITDSGEVMALELNVRMTAVTIPTLIFNSTNKEKLIFMEDQEDVQENDIILTYDPAGYADILREVY